MTTPEDPDLEGVEAPNWQERQAPGPRAEVPEKGAATAKLAAHLWGEPEEDDA